MIICDKILSARQFVEYYSGLYFSPCDTFREAQQCLESKGIHISDGYRLTEIESVMHKSLVLVEFSREEDYTEHDILAIPILKKYAPRFMRNMEEDQ